MDTITNANTILTVAALLVSVPSAAGAAFFIMKGSLHVAQIEALRKDNGDLRDRADDKDKEIAELEQDVAKYKNENSILKEENLRVWEQVTQKADVEGVKLLLNSVISLLSTKDLE